MLRDYSGIITGSRGVRGSAFIPAKYGHPLLLDKSRHPVLVTVWPNADDHSNDD